MYFLSFETSTKVFSLALSQDAKVLRSRSLKTDTILEDVILPAMDGLLKAAKVKFAQLDGFAIALGPGSFTSLRVGLSTVKAFALGTGKPVVGIPTMDIIAYPFCHSRETPSCRVFPKVIGNPEKKYDEICVVLDARREKVYACLYGPDGRRKSDYLLTTIDDILDKVHGKTLFVGDALGLYRPAIEEACRKYAKAKNNACQCLLAEEKYGYPQAKVMAALAFERFKNQQYDDAATLLPLYLYPQDCQVKTNVIPAKAGIQK
jgi:tRNA threonylcarbamoyladenosine biosynthesis protein TsaB